MFFIVKFLHSKAIYVTINPWRELSHGGGVFGLPLPLFMWVSVPSENGIEGGGFIRLITHLKSESTSCLILGSRNQQRLLKLDKN